MDFIPSIIEAIKTIEGVILFVINGCATTPWLYEYAKAVTIMMTTERQILANTSKFTCTITHVARRRSPIFFRRRRGIDHRLTILPPLVSALHRTEASVLL